MYVYRITLEKYSSALLASGSPARWNGKDVKMIYTASSRALACLENVVHRSALGLQSLFRTMVIEVPDKLPITIIRHEELPPGWQQFQKYPLTQSLGNAWIIKGETAVLQVPSAIIAEESNFLFNPLHKDFKSIRIKGTEPFEFDPRIKN